MDPGSGSISTNTQSQKLATVSSAQKKGKQAAKKPKVDRKLGRAKLKLAGQPNILASSILQKLNDDQALAPKEDSFLREKIPTFFTAYQVNESRTGEFLKAADMDKLREKSKQSPWIVGRAFSLEGPRHTNGFTTDEYFVPSAALVTRDLRMRNSISEISLAELVAMVGLHLLWMNRIQDELLSWTDSPLFAVIHAALRHREGQRMVYIAWINRTRATKPRNWYIDKDGRDEDTTQTGRAQAPEQPENAEPIEFFHALDLCDAINIYKHKWYPNAQKPHLHPRKFSHEHLSHGVAAYPADDILMSALYEDLVAAGLFEIIPEMLIDPGEMSAGLHTSQRHFRILLHSPWVSAKTTTNEHLDIVEKLAWLHTRLRPGEEKENSKPHLVVMMYYLMLQKRAKGDKLFQERIRKLGYTRVDLEEALHPGYEVVRENLPEHLSRLELLRDVQAVVGGDPIKDTVINKVLSTNRFSLQNFDREDQDFDNENGTPKVETEKKKSRYVETGRCGLSCDCSFWQSRKQWELKHGITESMEGVSKKKRKKNPASEGGEVVQKEVLLGSEVTEKEEENVVEVERGAQEEYVTEVEDIVWEEFDGDRETLDQEREEKESVLQQVEFFEVLD